MTSSKHRQVTSMIAIVHLYTFVMLPATPASAHQPQTINRYQAALYPTCQCCSPAPATCYS